MMFSMATDAADRLVADDFRSLLRLLINLDAIRAMDLIVGEHAILKNKPPRPPSFPIIHPLIEDPRDPTTHNVVQLHLSARREEAFMEGSSQRGRELDAGGLTAVIA